MTGADCKGEGALATSVRQGRGRPCYIGEAALLPLHGRAAARPSRWGWGGVAKGKAIGWDVGLWGGPQSLCLASFVFCP